MTTATDPKFDIAAAHAYFAAHCFNRAWELMEKPDRSSDDELLMVALNQASIYHWLQRPDCDSHRLSIGYWQASRIQALLRNSAQARHYAEVCLAQSHELEPFYVGYAHEALARAARLDGDAAQVEKHQTLGRALAGQVNDTDERHALLKDLESV